MASGANKRSANPENYLLPGSVSLFVRPKGSTDFDDWKDLGNLVDPAIAVALERLEHNSNRRGERAIDRTDNTQRGATLNFTIDEINLQNLQFAFGNFSTPTNDTYQRIDDETHANPGDGGVIQLGSTGLDSDVTVRSSDMEVDTVFVGGGTDYTFNAAAGTVTIVSGSALSVTATHPELHITFADTVNTKSFEAFSGDKIEVEAKFQCFTEGGTQFAFLAKNARLQNNGDIAIGDGSAYQTVPLQLELLVDTTGKLATKHVIKKPGV